MEPLPRGEGFKFVDAIYGGSIPRNFIPAVEKGFRETVEKGLLAGYPMVDIKFVLFDGAYHPVDSSEMAFRMCTILGMKEIINKTAPQLLEPIMKIEINTPDPVLVVFHIRCNVHHKIITAHITQ